MKTFLLITPLLVASFAFASELKINPKNCGSFQSKAPVLTMDDFPWGQTLPEMTERFDKIYNSGKRLKHRAFLLDGKVHLPEPQTKKPILLTNRFVNSVKTHIETALKLGYAQFIFFSDMGHSHLFVDKSFYENKVRDIGVENKNLIYESMFNHKQTRFLYHTAEQLEMLGPNKELLDDRQVRWRFFTSNSVGDNNKTPHMDLYHAEKSGYNTARGTQIDKEGKYKYWSAGFSISASKDGCFQYDHKGTSYFFDISLKDPEPTTGGGYLTHKRSH